MDLAYTLSQKLPIQWLVFPFLNIFGDSLCFKDGACVLTVDLFPAHYFQQFVLTGLDVTS